MNSSPNLVYSTSATNGGVAIVVGGDELETLDKLRKENIELIHRLAATQEKVWALDTSKKSYEEEIEKQNLDELLPAPDDDSWMEQAPPGLMQDVIQRLRSYASEGSDLPENATREIASRAMLELYRIIESSRSS